MKEKKVDKATSGSKEALKLFFFKNSVFRLSLLCLVHLPWLFLLGRPLL